MASLITPAPIGRPVVILSWGLGVDSTAILLRWLLDPNSRDFQLSELVVLVAQTGDEWPITGELVERYMLPLLRMHQVRVVQLARTARTKAEAAGCNYTVLDDTREPKRCYIEGVYKLSDEMLVSGTVPQSGGKRLCSVRAKGELLDWWVAAYTQGRPFTHVVGFELGELTRMERDRRMGSVPGRKPAYSLIDWGWFREDAFDYIKGHLGVEWEKSACLMCPYALASKDGRGRTISRFLAAPHLALLPLTMEHTACALNRFQGLIGGKRLIDELRRHPDAAELLAMHTAYLDKHEWALYDVRRALVLGKDGRQASARSLQIKQCGTRGDMDSLLEKYAEQQCLRVQRDGDHRRLEVRSRHNDLPTVEHIYAIAPRTAETKVNPSFDTMWERGLKGPLNPQEVLAV